MILPFCRLFFSVSLLIFSNPPKPTGTALLNGSPLFGKASTYRNVAKLDRPCDEQQFNLSILSDIPHSRGYYNRKAAITGCMEKCLPTQLVSFIGIPLQVGKYPVNLLRKCFGVSNNNVVYILLDGGDVTAGEFYAQEGWIEVTKFDSVKAEVEGGFEVMLRSPVGETMRFTNGAYKTKLNTSP